MELKEYLVFKDIDREDFAREIGTSKGYLDQIISGHRQAGKNLALKIEKATGGDVPLRTLLFGNDKEDQNEDRD